MSAARASLTEQTRMRLLDLWRGEDEFGRPLGCVTTSYTFDAELFEEQCLARFLSIQSNPNETAKAYLIEREEKLAQCFACVLVDGAHAAPDRSLRWHMLPVTLPSGGVLHAKLTLLAWERRVRLLIGSANLSEPAYRRNQEVMAVLDFSDDENPAPDVLAQCVAFLHRVRRFAPGFARTEAGPISGRPQPTMAQSQFAGWRFAGRRLTSVQCGWVMGCYWPRTSDRHHDMPRCFVTGALKLLGTGQARRTRARFYPAPHLKARLSNTFIGVNNFLNTLARHRRS
jgi:hypothetical protein